MTRSICIIGNSHLAALRQAWPALEAAYPEFDITFFGAQQNKLEALAFDNGVTRADSLELAKSLRSLNMPMALDMKAFDAIAITGCQIGIFHAMIADTVIADMPSYKGKGWFRREKRNLVSAQVYREMVRASLSDTIAHRLTRDLRDQTGVPVYICAQPHPSAAVLDPAKKRPLFRRTVESGDAPLVADLFADGLEAAFDGLATTLVQPAHTVDRHICTDQQYSTGSIRLANKRIEHEADDVLHGNELYGMAVMEVLLARITADLGEAGTGKALGQTA